MTADTQDVELGVPVSRLGDHGLKLCIGGHVSSALETPGMVTSADSSGVHET